MISTVSDRQMKNEFLNISINEFEFKIETDLVKRNSKKR